MKKQKNKKAVTIISNDWHLDKTNIEQVKEIIKQKCELAVKLEVEYLIFAGDLLESSVSQRQEVFVAIDEIFDIVQSYGLKIFVIPGNHDKTNKESEYSFLKPFKNHSAVIYIPNNKSVSVDGILFHFLPYFNTGCENFNTNFTALKSNTDTECKNVFIGHLALTGSMNNDGNRVESALKISDFDAFDLVLLGHYHNTHKVNHNIIHLPSIKQKNFGENNNKGFTVLYDDLSYEIIKSKTIDFEVYQFDMDKHTIDDLINVSNEIEVSTNKRIRFEVIGDKDIVSTMDFSCFENIGIDVKSKYNQLEQPIQQTKIADSLAILSEESIVIKFKNFCAANKLDFDGGSKLLNKIFNYGKR